MPNLIGNRTPFTLQIIPTRCYVPLPHAFISNQFRSGPLPCRSPPQYQIRTTLINYSCDGFCWTCEGFCCFSLCLAPPFPLHAAACSCSLRVRFAVAPTHSALTQLYLKFCYKYWRPIKPPSYVLGRAPHGVCQTLSISLTRSTGARERCSNAFFSSPPRAGVHSAKCSRQRTDSRRKSMPSSVYPSRQHKRYVRSADGSSLASTL